MTAPFEHGDSIALVIADGIGAALVTDGGATLELDADGMVPALFEIERTVAPRWVWWSNDTARTLVGVGLRPARCWISRPCTGSSSVVGAVAQEGSGPTARGSTRPTSRRRRLPTCSPNPATTTVSTRSAPTGTSTRPGSTGSGSRTWTTRWSWAALALDVHRWQLDELGRLPDRPAAPSTARSESAAALLCAELEADGLPIDVAVAERIIVVVHRTTTERRR